MAAEFIGKTSLDPRVAQVRLCFLMGGRLYVVTLLGAQCGRHPLLTIVPSFGKEIGSSSYASVGMGTGLVEHGSRISHRRLRKIVGP